MASTSHFKCGACQNVIKDREFLVCGACCLKFDIGCLNISAKRFHSFYAFNEDRKRDWRCDECRNKATNILKSPNNSSLQKNNDLNKPCSSNDNVTVRPKAKSNSIDSPQQVSPSPEPNYLTVDNLRLILKQELSDIRQTNIDLRESMTFFNSMFEDMKSQMEEKNALIQELKEDNIILRSTVKDLSNRLNLVEQNMRDGNIEVNGIPENKNENLVKTIEQLSRTVGDPIVPEDILFTTRVAKLNKDNDRPRTVIVKLRTPRHRDAVLAAVATHNRKNKEDKLCTHHLGYGGARKPVFVSEHLSPVNKSLHAATRTRAKEFNYKYTWVRNGRIFTRKDDFGEAILIRNKECLDLIN